MEALSRGDLDAAKLPPNEHRLMELVRTVTLHAAQTTTDDIRELKELGWTDDQLGEAVYVTALFAFFNRVADAFGLTDPGYRELAAQGQTPPPPAEKGS